MIDTYIYTIFYRPMQVFLRRFRITKKATIKVTFSNWSGQWDLDPRHRPWQGRALPLSYTRIA